MKEQSQPQTHLSCTGKPVRLLKTEVETESNTRHGIIKRSSELCFHWTVGVTQKHISAIKRQVGSCFTSSIKIICSDKNEFKDMLLRVS